MIDLSVISLSLICRLLSAAVQSVSILLTDGETEGDGDEGRTLHLTENHATRMRCIAVGGYPPPTLEVFSGRRDVTSEFFFRNGATLSGRRGMRLIVYRTERWSHSYRPRAQDDDTRFKCVATVPGLKATVKSAKLDIECKSSSN